MTDRTITVRRLLPADAAAYRALRMEGFATHPMDFRYSVADEEATSLADAGRRLAESFVAGAFAGGELVGIGGWTRFAGEKLCHKGLLWGMYVRPAARGSGAADEIVRAIVEDASREVRLLILTVAAHNPRARRLYERWGFEEYGAEPQAYRVGDAFVDEVLMVKHLTASADD
ncbi:MAG: GNAT family N-acetyltransferase [Gemmatimonadetes bacterium]|nr:GNAT family N-acetyltransferase [Gemmatimonadota bacterium]